MGNHSLDWVSIFFSARSFASVWVANRISLLGAYGSTFCLSREHICLGCVYLSRFQYECVCHSIIAHTHTYALIHAERTVYKLNLYSVGSDIAILVLTLCAVAICHANSLTLTHAHTNETVSKCSIWECLCVYMEEHLSFRGFTKNTYNKYFIESKPIESLLYWHCVIHSFIHSIPIHA